ncbi:MAG: hypothetical protein WC979_01375 [Candidatus Pacearchaeota archaeon]|nr:hypothetical protein [Clostridia bacterium]
MQQPQIDLSQAIDIVCNECQNPFFNEVVMIKKVSKFMLGADKDQVFPIPVLQCTKCGHVNEEFIPKVKQNKVSTDLSK